MTRNNITEAAKQFYFACENGTGWTNCQPYCHLDATFSSEAKTLREIDNLNHYTEWMAEVHNHMTDISFDVEGFAHDEEREVVLIYGIYRGVITMSETPQPFETDYVYILKFTDGKISHVTKVWQDDID